MKEKHAQTIEPVGWWKRFDSWYVFLYEGPVKHYVYIIYISYIYRKNENRENEIDKQISKQIHILHA